MRSVNGTIHKARRKKIMKQAKGFRSGRGKLYRTAKNAVMKAGQWAYRDRRQKKRFFRKLWIMRLNAACRAEGISYSVFINYLKKTNLLLNRKSLSEMAATEPEAFKEVIKLVKKQSSTKQNP